MIYAPSLRATAFGPGLRALDRSFERFVQGAMPQAEHRAPTATPTATGWAIEIDLPGVAREELGVSVDGAVVRLETIASARRPFKAAYELPDALDADASSAKLENGVLSLQLARQAPAVTARILSVQ